MCGEEIVIIQIKGFFRDKQRASRVVIEGENIIVFDRIIVSKCTNGEEVI